jgi:hypothetical protein
MTAQIPDTCMFDGRKWAIDEWGGDPSTVPSNERLGIETVSPHTANWSGRIDHFTVYKDRLFLLRIEVNLPEDGHDFLPAGARREVVSRYESWVICDKNGERNEIHEDRIEYFVFSDLPVPFTGELYLSYPYVDDWDHPWLDEDEDENTTEMILTFDEGILVGSERR